MKLTPTGPPQFGEPVVADPAATHEIPSHAVVESEYDMLVVSGGGEAQRERHHVTVQLKRTGKGWIITSI
jgi:putative intracellular protease/amidase